MSTQMNLSGFFLAANNAVLQAPAEKQQQHKVIFNINANLQHESFSLSILSSMKKSYE